jgi:hypothetical protein
MRNLTTPIAGAAALGLLFVGGSGSSHANTIVRTSPAFITPDANHFIKFSPLDGSSVIPTLNGQPPESYCHLYVSANQAVYWFRLVNGLPSQPRVLSLRRSP